MSGALSVNPFAIKETADSIYRALTMSGEERERRRQGLKDAVTARDPGEEHCDGGAVTRWPGRGGGEPIRPFG